MIRQMDKRRILSQIFLSLPQGGLYFFVYVNFFARNAAPGFVIQTHKSCHRM